MNPPEDNAGAEDGRAAAYCGRQMARRPTSGRRHGGAVDNGPHVRYLPTLDVGHPRRPSRAPNAPVGSPMTCPHSVRRPGDPTHRDVVHPKSDCSTDPSDLGRQLFHSVTCDSESDLLACAVRHGRVRAPGGNASCRTRTTYASIALSPGRSTPCGNRSRTEESCQ